MYLQSHFKRCFLLFLVEGEYEEYGGEGSPTRVQFYQRDEPAGS